MKCPSREYRHPGSTTHPEGMSARRLIAPFALIVALIAAALLAPPAMAAVHSTCTISRCTDARAARTGWISLGWPLSSGWYAWPAGRFNFTGGTFQNREHQLPANATYNEYDVYPRARGAARDAYRIVVNRSTKRTWFSPDHYVTFYEL
jgi:ribonuclease T1